MRYRTGAVSSISVILLALGWRTLAAEPGPSGGRDVDSVFSIHKSENKNQVHYGIRVDSSCHAMGAAPVHAYWRMNERNGQAEALLDIEQAAYGLADTQLISHTLSGSTVRVRIHSLSSRWLEVVTWGAGGGRCRARARTSIQGTEAWLDQIYVRLLWPFGIDWVRISGERTSDHSRVVEILRSP